LLLSLLLPLLSDAVGAEDVTGVGLLLFDEVGCTGVGVLGGAEVVGGDWFDVAGVLTPLAVGSVISNK
jgi:hypothetical protein